MSEEVMQRFLDRLSSDAGFRESVGEDPDAAFAEFGLSSTERFALAANDEDALRRLAGTDVQGWALHVGSPLGRLISPIDTTPDAGCQGGETRDWNCDPPPLGLRNRIP